MRLADLEPHWLTFEGRRVGFIFRCPLPDKRNWWQTCFVERFNLFGGSQPPLDEWCTADSQAGIVKACLPAAAQHFQGCNKDHQWTITGGIEAATFETLTVTPSLDGSAGGNWHGFITNGEIVGGI
jgi:hypothetical protein